MTKVRLIDANALKEWADESVKQYGNQYSTDMLNMFGLFKEVIDNAPTFESDWVKITFRKITDEEKEELREIADVDIIDSVYTCPLPDDGQKVLITTRAWRSIAISTFYNDVDGCYFEDWEDMDDVAAWMPLPKPYGGETE